MTHLVACRARLLLFSAALASPAAAQQFTSGQAQSTGVTGVPAYDLGDLDGDGDLDLVAGFGDGNQLAWFENVADGSGFGPARSIDTPSNVDSMVALADVDGDGGLDVVLGDYGGTIHWYANADGLGTFGAPQLVEGQAGVLLDLVVADFDGDGDADVVTATIAVDELRWYENLGGQSFAPVQVVDAPQLGAWKLHAADTDGDGAPELFAGGAYHVVRLTPDGSADGFGAATYLPGSGDLIFSIDSADLDGDGDRDILAASHWDGLVLRFDNLGNGQFASGASIPGSYGTSGVHAADVDGDGDGDLLVAGINYFDLAWSENVDGLGDFGPAQPISTAQVWPNGFVQTADIDGDGFGEIISMHQNYPGASEIRWWENLQQHLTAAPATVSVAAGGSQHFDLRAGAPNAGALYLVVGSASGIAPATPFGGAEWPLALDAYSLFTIGQAGGALLPGTIGLLDDDGRADAALVIPAGTDPALAGATLYHAFGLIDPAAPSGDSVSIVSSAVILGLVP